MILTMTRAHIRFLLFSFTLYFLSACVNATSWDDVPRQQEPVVVNPSPSIPQENLPPEVETAPLPDSTIILPPTESVPTPEPTPPPVQAEVVAEHPAVVALRGQAMEHLRLDQPEQAAASIERAIRIQPNNADLWLDLGGIRFSQQEYVQAEAMSKKAISYAEQMPSGKARLLYEAWILIANSRYARNDRDGGQKAEEQAKRYDPSLSRT